MNWSFKLHIELRQVYGNGWYNGKTNSKQKDEFRVGLLGRSDDLDYADDFYFEIADTLYHCQI